MVKKVRTLDDWLALINEKHQGTVTLTEGQVFVGIRGEMLFIDRDYGPWFTNIFKLYYNGNCHPARAKANRVLVCQSRYGKSNPAQVSEFLEKAKETTRIRYGSDHFFQTEQFKLAMLEKFGETGPFGDEAIREKARSTLKARLGVENPFQASCVKEAIKRTNLEKLGVENPSQAEATKEKKRSTTRKNHGTDYPLQSKEVKEKARQTHMEKYGENNYKISIAHRLPNGLSLSAYLLQAGAEVNRNCAWSVYRRYGFEALTSYVERGERFKVSSLEVFASQAFGLPLYNRQVIQRYRPDFKLADRIFLDVDGLYWHSNAEQKNQAYHLKKRLAYEAGGMRLIQLHEDEVLLKTKIVTSLITHLTGKSHRIAARKLSIEKLCWEDYSNFMKLNHLQGVGPKAKSWCLALNGTPIQVIGLRNDHGEVELVRMATLVNTAVQGGFSRLLAFIERHYKPTLIRSWCDLRYADGRGYEAVGFERQRDVLGWRWTDFHITYSRLSCRANMDERRLSEAEYASLLGWHRIYDAGQRLYIKRIMP